MVKINYIDDPTQKNIIIYDCVNIAEFVCSKCNNRDEVLDLVFFSHDTFGQRIKPYAGFELIDTGEYTVISNKKLPNDAFTVGIALAEIFTWANVAIFALSFAATYFISKALMPDMPEIETGSTSRNAESATNSITRSTNDQRINQRTDDIFGKVTKHIPSIMQVPYTIGINDIEHEVLFGVVGRGHYEIDTNEIFDGITRYNTINGASINIYQPNEFTNDNNEKNPQISIGSIINEPVGIYRNISSIQRTELEPPFDENEITPIWHIYWYNNNTANLYIDNYQELDFDFRDNIFVGDRINIFDFRLYIDDGTITINHSNGSTTVDALKLVYLTGTYEVLQSEENYISISIPDNHPQHNDWSLLPYFTELEEFDIYLISEDLRPNPRSVAFTKTDVTNLESATIERQGTYQPYQSPVIIQKFKTDSLTIDGLLGVSVGAFRIDDDAEYLITNIASPSGFYQIINNQDPSEKTIDINILISEIDDDGNLTGNSQSYNVTYNSNPKSVTRSVFRTFKTYVGNYAKKQVTYKRLTPDTKLVDDNASISNVTNAFLVNAYSFQSCDVSAFGDCTTWHSLVKNNGQKQRQTNMTVTRKLRVLNEFGQSLFVSSNNIDFATILAHMATDPYIGRLELDDINYQNLHALKTEHSDYFGTSKIGEFGHNFDTVDITFQEMFATVCNAVNLVPFTRGTQYDVFFDRQQNESSMFITCRNKFYESEEHTPIYEEIHDGIELTYRDNETGNHEIILYPDENVTNPKRVEAQGIIHSEQALVKIKRLYNRQKYGMFQVKFDVDEFGRNIVPNKRIDSPDGTRYTIREDTESNYRIYDGTVVEIVGLVVELDTPITFTDNENHYIRFSLENGNASESILCTSGDDDYHIVLNNLPVESIYDGYDREKTNFIFMSENVNDSIALLPLTIESKTDNNEEINSVSCINYDDRYYKGDFEV